MSVGLLGKKLGMTQVFTDDGKMVPVTVVKAGPCTVMQVKTVERDGYEALQLGFEDKKRSRARRAESGKAKKIDTEPKRFVREIRQAVGEYAEGDVVDVGALAEAKYVDICGVSKGKGFAGVVKRWRFKGYPASHGSGLHRGPGSIGQASWPSRVFKGMRMAGHMGSRKCTSKRLEVVKADTEKGLLLVKGSVPGATGSYVIIKVSDQGSDKK
jgi:large subunit ribosomal protein L3